MYVKSVHMGQKIQCPDCVYQATQKCSLVTHQRIVHLGQKLPKFGCHMCSASTPYKENGTLYMLSDLLELHQVYNINKRILVL